jgi:mannan endo-1,4-beta-mannosidase
MDMGDLRTTIQERLSVKRRLANPNANEAAKRLMNYLCDIYGTKLLTGQQIGVTSTPEDEVLYRATGKHPAVFGFDFMNDSPSRTERGSIGTDTELALKWWEEGGIVTFCWHWNAPKDLIDEAPDRLWHSGFYTKATTFDLAKAMDDPHSEDYQLLLRDMDVIAGLLKRLQDAGVPVLWRPLHEASGGWFWWGAKGPEPCIKLWILMFERFTKLHRLNNLIWVWNGQHKDWYPGDEYVDIIGEDIYGGERNYSSQHARFQQALDYTSENKIITLSENGTLPDPDELIRDGAPWAWNCTWYGSFVWEKQDDGSIVYSEKYTELEMLKKFYAHPFTLTREDLPNLRNYPIKE